MLTEEPLWEQGVSLMSSSLDNKRDESEKYSQVAMGCDAQIDIELLCSALYNCG